MRYKIKRHAKLGEIFTDYSNRRSATLDSLLFLQDGERIHEDQTLSSLNLSGSITIDCFPAQGGPATPWLANPEGNSWMDRLRPEEGVFEDSLRTMCPETVQKGKTKKHS